MMGGMDTEVDAPNVRIDRICRGEPTDSVCGALWGSRTEVAFIGAPGIDYRAIYYCVTGALWESE